jgi:chlorophyll synthase
VVVILLLQWDRPWHALAIVGLMFGQSRLMGFFIASPIERALKMSAFGVPLLVAGMMVAAFGLRMNGG